MKIIYTVFLTFIILSIPATGSSQSGISPAIGLSPDNGYPVWLTPDADNYFPLRTNQTSGMDLVAIDSDENGSDRHWLVIADDADDGGIHLISIPLESPDPTVRFHPTNLTPLPLNVSLLPINRSVGYDWEAISLHPWSNSVFIVQEGSLGDISIYHGSISPGDIDPGENARNQAGEIDSLIGYITNLRQLDLPGWNETFASKFQENLGIEGIACVEDRLFVGLESPFTNAQRFFNETSTVFAIWKINPDDPSDMESCELLAACDTADWKDILGYTIEVICGLDAVDRNHVAGIDRDNRVLFAVDFSDSGEFTGGRIFYLDTPGPAPLPSDNCSPIDHSPTIILPSLESLALVPGAKPDPYSDTGEKSIYYAYLAVDPWAPGWTLSENDWSCPSYEERLNNLLPALYRYTIETSQLFPNLGN